MKIAVIQFPGSNCEAESLRAVREAGMEAEEFLWNRDYKDLERFDGYFIVGGFSYEDRSRAGIIAALDPLMPHLRSQTEKGKPLLGICNGAQILVETGLVPGLAHNTLSVALATNKRVLNNTVLGTGYYNAWVHMQLSVPPNSTAFTRHLVPGKPLFVPVAHGEGRFIIPDELLKEMISNNLTTFRYCSHDGQIVEEFPVNPNGAAYNLAAISNPAGNIMAMMPHPERSNAGAPLFSSMREYISEKKTIHASQKISFTPPAGTISQYAKPAEAHELPIELIITDNEAATVEATLQRLGFPVMVERAVHWEVNFDGKGTQNLQTIIDSGELFNSNKERLAKNMNTGADASRLILVRYRQDFDGQAKTQALQGRLGLSDVSGVTRGTLWKITSQHGSIDAHMEGILASHILFNPFSQEAFYYE
jgi:phosphoribosylformylglycinamidine synthase